MARNTRRKAKPPEKTGTVPDIPPKINLDGQSEGEIDVLHSMFADHQRPKPAS